MAESMHMEMGESEKKKTQKTQWSEISLARGEDKVRYRRIDYVVIVICIKSFFQKCIAM